MFAGWEEYRLINKSLGKLTDELPPSGFGEVIRHVLSTPGKRVRPLILVTSSQAFGGEPDEAMDAALAIELVHAASLVHDDILDCGIERRGEPSTLERYGRDAALLCGDYLISRSIDLISGYKQPVIKAFSAACMKMSLGEMLDLTHLSSQEEYYRCISAKTASLFAASAKIGCLISGASEDNVSRFECFGQNLGLGYQIMDDLEEYLGVDQGKASEKSSVTLPRIYDSNFRRDDTRELCINAIRNHGYSAKQALMDSSGDKKAKDRLTKIVDQMILHGMEECRSLKSLC
jgi:octaprenyl-diphosphate synthase